MDNEIGAELPRYRCHKQVWALKIRWVEAHANGSAALCPEDETYAPVEVDAVFVTKHLPKNGGYYVVYDDGYKSFSPAAAFENGYTRIA